MPIDIIPLVFLLLGTFAVAFFVAAIGPTGGLQLAITGAVLPPNYVIPIHAWISGFSAMFRMAGLRKYIQTKFVMRFILPSIAFTSLAIFFGKHAGFEWVKLFIGIYIILDASGAIGHFEEVLDNKLRASPEMCGAITGFVTAFIGSSGSLLWALMRNRFNTKEALSATHAACLVAQHLSKIILFGLIGISVFSYWPLLAALTISSLLGTFLGQRRLRRFSEARYRHYLKLALFFSGGVIIFLGLKGLATVS